MNFYTKNGIETSPELDKNCITALGYFDGVHKGHLALFEKVAQEAELCGAVPAVWTFYNGHKAPNICDDLQKVDIILDCGIEYVAMSDFEEIKDYSPEKFVSEVLIKALHSRAVVCGDNFRFGKGAVGDCSSLSEILSKYGIPLFVIPVLCADGEPISSSRIRTAIQGGDIELANLLSVRPFSLSSAVVHGKALGRELGFPTINQYFSNRSIKPKSGVYISSVFISGESYLGVSNVGTNPTVSDGEDFHIETYIIGFSGDLYGKTVKTELLSFLRDEMKFVGVDELVAQISSDIESAKSYSINRKVLYR